MPQAGAAPSILTVNGGSSSIRFAIHARGEPPVLRLRGKIDRIGVAEPGQAGATLSFSDAGTTESGEIGLEGSDHWANVTALIDWLEQRGVFARIDAIGHRACSTPNPPKSRRPCAPNSTACARAIRSICRARSS